jgi:hypothetical protein
MDFVKDVRICEERAKTGLRAEIEGPAMVFDAREISGVGVLEFASAECDEAWVLFREGRSHPELAG